MEEEKEESLQEHSYIKTVRTEHGMLCVEQRREAEHEQRYRKSRASANLPFLPTHSSKTTGPKQNERERKKRESEPMIFEANRAEWTGRDFGQSRARHRKACPTPLPKPQTCREWIAKGRDFMQPNRKWPCPQQREKDERRWLCFFSFFRRGKKKKSHGKVVKKPSCASARLLQKRKKEKKTTTGWDEGGGSEEKRESTPSSVPFIARQCTGSRASFRTQ